MATTAGELAVIDRANFKAALGAHADTWGVLQDRMFFLLDVDRHDVIYFPNFVQTLSIIIHGSLKEKARCISFLLRS